MSIVVISSKIMTLICKFWREKKTPGESNKNNSSQENIRQYCLSLFSLKALLLSKFFSDLLPPESSVSRDNDQVRLVITWPYGELQYSK